MKRAGWYVGPLLLWYLAGGFLGGCGDPPPVDACGGCATGEQCRAVVVTVTGAQCYPFASCDREGHLCVDPRKVNMGAPEAPPK